MTPTQQAMAKRMINAAICSYQVHPADWQPGPDPGPPVLTKIWSANGQFYYDVVPAYQDAVGFATSAEQGFVPLFTSDGADDINAAIVGMMDDGNLLIAIRGTIPPTFDNDDIINWMRDWAQDGDIPPRVWTPRPIVFTDTMQAENGFSLAMLDLWPRLIGMIDQILGANTVTGICITGHSKGAAMTLLCADLVAIAYPQFQGAIQVHAFACPAAVNPGFVQSYDALGLGIATHRYQVQNDVVPFLPLWTVADIYLPPDGIAFSNWGYQLLWLAFGGYVTDKTKGGYVTAGDFTYFADCKEVPGATPDGTALTAVAAMLLAGDFGVVADAHSAIGSYLPCFD